MTAQKKTAKKRKLFKKVSTKASGYKKKSTHKKKPTRKKTSVKKKVAKKSKKKSTKKITARKEQKTRKNPAKNRKKKKTGHSVQKLVDKKLTDFFSANKKNRELVKDHENEKIQTDDVDKSGKNLFEEDIDFIDNEDLSEGRPPESHFEVFENDPNIEDEKGFESFEENNYSPDEDEEEAEINFDDPFDNLEDLDEEDEDDEGSLF